MEIEKKSICQRITSLARLTIVEWRSTFALDWIKIVILSTHVFASFVSPNSDLWLFKVNWIRKSLEKNPVTYWKAMIKNPKTFTIKALHRKKKSEAATGGVLWEKVFLEISQNSQENTCVRVSFLIKLRPFLQNTSGWLLLKSETFDGQTLSPFNAKCPKMVKHTSKSCSICQGRI